MEYGVDELAGLLLTSTTNDERRAGGAEVKKTGVTRLMPIDGHPDDVDGQLQWSFPVKKGS